MYQYYQNCRIPLGTDVATKLPQIHAVTGCNTTSFLHGVVIIQTVFYSGKEEDSQTETKTRVRLYKQMNQLISLYHQIKSRCCKQLKVFTMKFITVQP